jgi:hypothetical protein
MTARLELAPAAAPLLASLGLDRYEALLELEGGERHSQNRPWRLLHRVPLGDGAHGWLKRYRFPRPSLRFGLFASPLRREWRNLRWLAARGLPVAEPLAFGERRNGLALRDTLLLTREVAGARDLRALLAAGRPPDPRGLIHALADATAAMHRAGFCHRSLRWQDVLARQGGAAWRVFFLDCPGGGPRRGWWLRAGIVRDLAHLDRDAPGRFTRAERLRFLRRWLGPRWSERRAWLPGVSRLADRFRRRRDRARSKAG